MNSLMHHGTHYGLSFSVGLVEQSVEVWQEGVSDVQVMLGGLHQQRVGTVCCRVLVLLDRDIKLVRKSKLKRQKWILLSNNMLWRQP